MKGNVLFVILPWCDVILSLLCNHLLCVILIVMHTWWLYKLQHLRICCNIQYST